MASFKDYLVREGDAVQNEEEVAPQQPAMKESTVDRSTTGMEASVSFQVYDAEPQLSPPDWFQDQGDATTTPELSLYTGLSEAAAPEVEDEEGGSLYNLLVLSMGFFFLFSAYNTLGEFVTSVLPDSLGDKSMLLNSFVQSIAVFAAPGVVATTGEARSIALGGLAYVVYISSLITGLPMAVLTASALLGLGSSIVWVAQGSFLTRCCPAKLRGAYSGVFYCFYFSSNILGNLAAYYAFKLLKLQSMFSLFAVVAMLGVLILLQLVEFPAILAIATPQEVDETALDHSSGSESEGGGSDSELVYAEEDRGEDPAVQEGVSADPLPDSRRDDPPHSRVTTLLIYSLLAPMSFYTGFEVLAVTGVGEVIGALGLGMVSDYLGRRAPTFIAGSLVFLYGLYLCIPLYEAAKLDELLQPTLLGAPVVAYVSGFTFGVGDGVFNGHMFTVISSIFSPDDLEAWALFNLLGTLGSAAAFAYGIAKPLNGTGGSLTQVYTQAGILMIGTLLYVVVDTLLVHWQRQENLNAKRKIS